MLGQPQHLSGIGTGKLRDMVTRNDMSQCVHSALGIQRVDLGIGAFIRDILLDKQMAVGQCSDLRCVSDAEDLVIFCALFEHLTDAAGRLAGHTAVDLIVDDRRHCVLIGHSVLDCQRDTAQLTAGSDFCQRLGILAGVCGNIKLHAVLAMAGQRAAGMAQGHADTRHVQKIQCAGDAPVQFLEFNYMIMQSYDFYYMFQHYGCNMQFGGDDQWSNMLGGTELIRRKLGKDAYAMTITLLTDSQGKKMGKTAGNAVWLDPNKTSPFEFYQYWRNVGDADVMKCIRMLTFLPLEQIDEMSTWKDQRLNEAKEILAYELTKMVHGEEEAEKAQNAARALFSGAADTEHMPSTQLTEADLTDGSIGILTLMVKAGLAASNGEARRLVVQGGVLVDGEKVAAPTVSFTADQLKNGIVIKKGKKIYHKVTL